MPPTKKFRQELVIPRMIVMPVFAEASCNKALASF